MGNTALAIIGIWGQYTFFLLHSQLIQQKIMQINKTSKHGTSRKHTTLSSHLDYQHHSDDSILNGCKLVVGALQSPIILLPIEILT